jgi:hypothetical protein
MRHLGMTDLTAADVRVPGIGLCMVIQVQTLIGT